jgi:hypothetical protein
MTQLLRRQRVKFVANNTPRDVQTASAIRPGILEEEEEEEEEVEHINIAQQYFNDNSPPIRGLHNIQLDPYLLNHFYPKQQQHDNICALPPQSDNNNLINYT